MPTTINNEASATYQLLGAGTSETVSSNTQSLVLEDSQGLSITKTSVPSEVIAGDIVAYTVTITNNSSQYLTGVRIIDNLGGGNLAYVVGTGNLSIGSLIYPVTPVATNPLTFTLQELSPGATMTLSYRAQVIFNLPESVQSITNSVQGIGYTSTGTINGFANNTIVKKNSLDFSLSKTASETEVLPNQLLNYYLTLSNNNSVAAAVTSITDQLPTGFNVTGVSLKQGSGSVQNLSSSDYTLSSTNLLTVPSLTGPIINVSANSNAVITVSGYFN